MIDSDDGVLFLNFEVASKQVTFVKKALNKNIQYHKILLVNNCINRAFILELAYFII